MGGGAIQGAYTVTATGPLRTPVGRRGACGGFTIKIRGADAALVLGIGDIHGADTVTATGAFRIPAQVSRTATKKGVGVFNIRTPPMCRQQPISKATDRRYWVYLAPGFADLWRIWPPICSPMATELSHPSRISVRRYGRQFRLSGETPSCRMLAVPEIGGRLQPGSAFSDAPVIIGSMSHVNDARALGV